MSLDRVLFPAWRRENEPTKYPFSPRARLTNAAGLVLTEGTFLDASLFPVGAAGPLYLSKAVVTHEAAVLSVGDAADPARCTGTVRLVNPAADVPLADAVGRPAGLLVSEPARLTVIQSWGVGTHEFTPDDTEFCATCCVPTPEVGLRGVLLESGELLTGDVWLLGSDGVVLRGEDVTVPGPCGTQVPVTVVRVDVVGDPLFRRRLCQPGDLFATPNPVRAVRVVGPDGAEFEVTPDERGNLQLAGNNALAADTVLRLVPTPAGLTVELVGGPQR